MKIKITDINQEPLELIELTFEFNKQKKTFITDSEGYIELSDIENGTKISCYFNSKEKQKFVFDHNAELQFQFKTPEIDLEFIAIGSDSNPVQNALVYFEFADKKVEKKSNYSGHMLLEKVPVNSTIRSYQVINGETRNLASHKCTQTEKQFKIITENPTSLISMKIKLVDKTGQAIKNADLRIKTSNGEFDAESGHDGIVVIDDVEVGSDVECKQIISGKTLPWHKFKCEEEIDEYILHGERPSIYPNYSDKIESQVRMKFRLVNSKGIPIPNAVLRLEYGEWVRNKYTNQYGEAMIDDIMIGDKIKAYVDIRGKNTESEFICQEDNEMHDIVLRSTTVSMYFWILPLFVVIGFLIYYASSLGNGKDKQEDNEIALQTKDTVVISQYDFVVKNVKTGYPVANAKIKLVYSDTILEKVTDQRGLASFKAFVQNLPLRYELGKLGYFPVKTDFKIDSIFNVKMTQNDSIQVDPVIGTCGIEIQSKGAIKTIKSIKMNMPKGRFNIWYNLFNLPTKVDVYKGSFEKISPENLIFSNKGYMLGISNPSMMFESADSLITVCFEGNKANTAWVYKVYCAKIPAKPVVPVAPANGNPM